MQINEQAFKAELSWVFKENRMAQLLNAEKSEKFLRLTERMLSENEKYNLTAIKEPDKIILNHYADSAALTSILPKGASIIDVGCGAGFPSLPLAIVREDLKILAIDSTAKRIDYVNKTAEMLGLNNINAAVMRAEDGGKLPEYREKFDFATARAVSEMRILAELCFPFIRVGGYMLAMKGKNAEFELSGAKRAIAILGGTDAKIKDVHLVGKEQSLTHPIISVKKITKTPMQYPRVYSQISKKPL